MWTAECLHSNTYMIQKSNQTTTTASQFWRHLSVFFKHQVVTHSLSTVFKFGEELLCGEKNPNFLINSTKIQFCLMGQKTFYKYHIILGKSHSITVNLDMCTQYLNASTSILHEQTNKRQETRSTKDLMKKGVTTKLGVWRRLLQ